MQFSAVGPSTTPGIVDDVLKDKDTIFVRCFMPKKGRDLYARADLSTINKVIGLKFTVQRHPFADYADWEILKCDPNALPAAFVFESNQKVSRVVEEILVNVDMNSNVYTAEEGNALANAIANVCHKAFPYMNPAYSAITVHLNGQHCTYNFIGLFEIIGQ